MLAISQNAASVGDEKAFSAISGSPKIFSIPVDCPNLDPDSTTFTPNFGFLHDGFHVSGESLEFL